MRKKKEKKRKERKEKRIDVEEYLSLDSKADFIAIISSFITSSKVSRKSRLPAPPPLLSSRIFCLSVSTSFL